MPSLESKKVIIDNQESDRDAAAVDADMRAAWRALREELAGSDMTEEGESAKEEDDDDEESPGMDEEKKEARSAVVRSNS